MSANEGAFYHCYLLVPLLTRSRSPRSIHPFFLRYTVGQSCNSDKPYTIAPPFVILAQDQPSDCQVHMLQGRVMLCPDSPAAAGSH